MSDDSDTEYRPSSRIDESHILRRNQTRSYRAPSVNGSDEESNFDTAANLDTLLSSVGNPSVYDNELNMEGTQEAIRNMKEAFEAVALASKQNDVRILADLPHFGIAADPDGKKWILDSCTDFLEHISKATADESWNDSGRIKVLRNKLLGPALEYFNDFDGNTMVEAKQYLLKMFHDPTTHASVSAEIERCKRRTGEQFTYFAIRIAKLYAKLKRVSTNDLTDNWIEKSKKELLLKSCPSAVRNFVKVDDESYDELLKKVLDYLECNTQHKMTRADIEDERNRQIKQINAVKDKKANNQTLIGNMNHKNMDMLANQRTATDFIYSCAREKGVMKPRVVIHYMPHRTFQTPILCTCVPALNQIVLRINW